MRILQCESRMITGTPNNKSSHMTLDATCGAGTACSFRSPEFTTGFWCCLCCLSLLVCFLTLIIVWLYRCFNFSILIYNFFPCLVCLFNYNNRKICLYTMPFFSPSISFIMFTKHTNILWIIPTLEKYPTKWQPKRSTSVNM